MTKETPAWYSSKYRGVYNFDKNEIVIHNKKPLRCPYCGSVMNFHVFHGYGTKSSDWYWTCRICHLSLGNKKEFSKGFLNGARNHWRKHLLKEMTESKDRYHNLKEQYESYGTNFTPKEKREVLVETIEKQSKEESIE